MIGTSVCRCDPHGDADSNPPAAVLYRRKTRNGLIIIPKFSTLIKNYVGKWSDNYVENIKASLNYFFARDRKLKLL